MYSGTYPLRGMFWNDLHELPKLWWHREYYAEYPYLCAVDGVIAPSMMAKKNKFWAEGPIHTKQVSWPLPHTLLFSNLPAMNRICRLRVEEEARSLHIIWQVDWVWQRLSSLLFIWEKIQNMLQAPRHAFRVVIDWRDLIFPLHRIVWTPSTKHSLGNQSSKNTFKAVTVRLGCCMAWH